MALKRGKMGFRHPFIYLYFTKENFSYISFCVGGRFGKDEAYKE